MNYNTDKPITKQEDDLLGKSTFSKQLGKTIYECNATDGLVIGLYGKWGIGKTSIINMTIEEINNLSENDKKEEKPLIIKFNPWNYSDKNNLINLFFKKLKNTLGTDKYENLKKVIGDALNNYSDILDILNQIPLVGSTPASLLKILTKKTGSKLVKNLNLDETKEQLREKLLEANNKIIVVIDDIDRLTNSQIKDIFQLVKQVGDFPNIIYILVMDRKIVSNALNDIHNIDGNKYLEKIVQVSFELPPLSSITLKDNLVKKLTNLNTTFSSEEYPYKEYRDQIIRNCILPYIKNLRDINRLINTLEFRYNLLHNETSFEDLVSLTTIEVLEPKLYKWIFNNNFSLLNGFNNLLHSKEEFKNLGLNPELSISFISTIFPENLLENQELIRNNMRIADKERFNLYFMFNLDEVKIPRKQVNLFINDLNEIKLNTEIDNIFYQGKIHYFLDELSCLIDKIPENRLTIISRTLLNLEYKFREDDASHYKGSSSFKSNYLSFNIIKKIKSEDEKTDFIDSLLQNADINSLSSIANIISQIKQSCDSKTYSKDQIISLDKLRHLEKSYLNKIHSILEANSIIDIKNFKWAFRLWEELDSSSVETYMRILFQNDVNILKFICGIADYTWTGYDNSGCWSFYPYSFTKYIPKDEIYNTILNFDKDKLLEFKKIEQEKLNSFISIYKQEHENTNKQNTN